MHVMVLGHHQPYVVSKVASWRHDTDASHITDNMPIKGMYIH